MLSCVSVGKRFTQAWVFRNVSLSLEPGQCLIVSGANGSGKSTLLKVMAGLEVPSEGRVEREIDLRSEVGYSATDLRLYPSLSTIEHLELAATLKGVPADGNLVDRVGLGSARSVFASAFSTGMRARLKLALALLGSPRVLLLDEPGAGLDAEGRGILAGAIDEQRDRGAVVIATNDPAEREYGDFELTLG